MTHQASLQNQGPFLVLGFLFWFQFTKGFLWEHCHYLFHSPLEGTQACQTSVDLGGEQPIEGTLTLLICQVNRVGFDILSVGNSPDRGGGNETSVQAIPGSWAPFQPRQSGQNPPAQLAIPPPGSSSGAAGACPFTLDMNRGTQHPALTRMKEGI